MGKVKFVIVAAIILFVQSGSAQNIANVGSPVQIKNVSAADDCDWPMFGRTPDGNRVVPDGCGIDLRNLGVKWTFRTDHIVNEPVLKNNLAIFTCWNHKVFCLDAVNGNKIWEFEAGDAITSSPSIYKEFVFFASMDFKIYCLNTNYGSKKWEFKTGFYILSSPMVYDEKVYVACEDGQILCLKPDDGRIVWKKQNEFSNHYSPSFHEDKMFIGSASDFYCLNAKTGQLIWKYNLWADNFKSVLSSAVVYNGYVLFRTSKGLMCLDEVTGVKKWCYETQLTIDHNTPVVQNNTVYFSQGVDNTKLFAIDLITGIKKKDIEIEPTLGPDLPSPLFCRNKIFLPIESGLSAYEPDSLNRLLLLNIDDELMNYSSSPIIGNNCILLGFGDRLICLYNDSSRNEPIKPKEVLLSTPANKYDLCSSIQFSARVIDIYEEEIKNPELEWSVDPAFGTIDATGLFKPSKTGVATITCRCGDAVATVDINVVDYLVPSVKTLVLTNVKPYQDYKTTLTYTNNSDARLDVKLTSTTDLITLSPTSFSVDAGKTFDILVSCKLKEFTPSAVTSFTINADYGGCPDILHGTIMNADKYDCFKVSPEMLDFGLVKRGDSKTMSLTIESNAKQTLTISCDQPWVEISKKTITVDVGQKETIDFKIMASSLPASSKLTANITVISDLNFCEQTTIPLLVSTEDSITIKLQVDSRNATINGQERMLDVPARIIAGRTMVPLRFISESFGCSILWDPTTQKIGIVRYDITVNLWIGKDFVEVNGNKLKIDAPPVIVGGRTMVPLRFIAEPFGAKVDWNAQTKEITITWPK